MLNPVVLNQEAIDSVPCDGREGLRELLRLVYGNRHQPNMQHVGGGGQ
jgi:hypothetical protein